MGEREGDVARMSGRSPALRGGRRGRAGMSPPGGSLASQGEARALRAAFLAGAVTDAGALVPMLWPAMADLLWGFDDVTGSYRAFHYRSRSTTVPCVAGSGVARWRSGSSS